MSHDNHNINIHNTSTPSSSWKAKDLYRALLKNKGGPCSGVNA